jgi:elongation factor P
MAEASQLKSGNVIIYNNELHQLVDVEHRTPGNLRAFYQVKMKNLKNGKMIENRFRPNEDVELVRLETKDFQYLYKDGDDFQFMDMESYEQINIPNEVVGKQGDFLKEGQMAQIVFHDSNPLNLELPPHVELKVTEAPPAVKGNTATGATKVVIVETGASVNAPLFIDEGEVIKVDVRTGDYIERVKS